MAAAIKQSTTQLSYNPDQYGTRSVRSGGATPLFASGVDRLVVKLFGRWSSDTEFDLRPKSFGTCMQKFVLQRVSISENVKQTDRF